IQIGFGRKEWSDFDFGEVEEAGLTGVVAGGLSRLGSWAADALCRGFAAQAFAQAGAAAGTHAINNPIHRSFHPREEPSPASFSGWSLLTATVGGGATPVLGGFFSRLYLEALNPQTGWVWHPNARAWDALYQELAMGLGQVVIQDSFGSPRRNSPKPEQRSQPMPAELLDMFDEIDRQYIEELDRMARLAQNQQIAAASDESLQLQLQLTEWQDRIDHFGEAINIDSDAFLRQKNHQRVQRVQAAAAARARREAILDANTARLKAKMAKPDLQY